jgi:hypothetical protein
MPRQTILVCRLFSWEFDRDSSMEVIVRGAVSTAEVLDMLEKLIAIKRDELAEIGRGSMTAGGK